MEFRIIYAGRAGWVGTLLMGGTEVYRTGRYYMTPESAMMAVEDYMIDHKIRPEEINV